MIKKPLILLAAVLLASCASPQQQTELNKLHGKVGKLNNEMKQLTEQASSLEQQNMLNSTSNQGAWLLPGTHTAVILKSQAGDLRLSLNQVETEANGTRATLAIRSAGANTLPGFSAQIEWGERDPVSGKPLQVDSQSQSVQVSASLLPRSEVIVPLRLSNITPEQLGYVRVHDIVVESAPATEASPATAE